MRLRPYTTILPKPLVPVGDRPILEHILQRLASQGVTRIDLCIGHLGELIRVYFSEGTTLADELDLRWHWETGEPLGTAGALRTVPDLEGTFMVMNGDVLTDLDHRALVEHHREREAILTVATRRRAVDLALGVVEHADGLIVDYREKPTLHFEVSMGVYVYDHRALDYLPEGPCQFPELVQRLLEGGERVAAFHSDAEWYDVGTINELERAAEAVARREPPPPA
jgi:mannose-1-phosphate guanylyltransferase